MKRLLSFTLAFLVLALAPPAAMAADIVGSDESGTVTLTISSVTVDPKTGVATVTGVMECEPNTDPNVIVQVSDAHIHLFSRRSNDSTLGVVNCQPFSIEIESLGEPFKPGWLHVTVIAIVEIGIPDRLPGHFFLSIEADTIALPTQAS